MILLYYFITITLQPTDCACCVWFHLLLFCFIHMPFSVCVCVYVCPVYCIVCIRAIFACITSYLPCLNTEPALDAPKPKTLSALQPVEERPTSLLPIPTLRLTDKGLGCRGDGESAVGQSCSTLTPSETDTRQLLRTYRGQQRTWLHCNSVLLCHNTDCLNN